MWLSPAFGNDKVEQLCMKAVTLTVASPLLLICSKANMLYNSGRHSLNHTGTCAEKYVALPNMFKDTGDRTLTSPHVCAHGCVISW